MQVSHLDTYVVDVVCLIEYNDALLLQLTGHHLRHLQDMERSFELYTAMALSRIYR